MKMVSLATQTGEYEARAEVIGRWAVHGLLGSDYRIARRGSWVLTHVPTGRRLSLVCSRKSDAVSLARALEADGFNPHVQPTKDDRATFEGIRDRWAEARGLRWYMDIHGERYAP